QCNVSTTAAASSTSPTKAGFQTLFASSTPAKPSASPAPTQTPNQICSGVMDTTNVIFSARGTTESLQKFFSALQPHISWIPASSPQQAQPVMGDATLPASEEWALPGQGMGVSAPPAGFPGPAPSGTWAADTNAATIAASVAEAPTVRSEVSAPVIDKVENPAHLILRADNGDVLQDYTLEKLETSIGRAPTSDILLSKDKLTSRRHATVSYENGNYVIVDERSANGTFVNGQQLEEMTPRTLQDGDHIGIGEHELVFQTYQSSSPGVDIESMPTITVGPSAMADITYRTREDELLAASSIDDFSTRSMNGGDSASSPEALAEPETPSTSNDVAPASVSKVEEPAEPVVPTVPAIADSSTGVTFSRLT